MCVHIFDKLSSDMKMPTCTSFSVNILLKLNLHYWTLKLKHLNKYTTSYSSPLFLLAIMALNLMNIKIHRDWHKPQMCFCVQQYYFVISYPSFKTRLASTMYSTMFVPISDRQNTAISTLAFFSGTCIANQHQENIHHNRTSHKSPYCTVEISCT